MWQQQHPLQTASSRSGTGAGVQQGQQLPQLMDPVYWQSVFKLLLECLLLAPSPDMASSCLPLMTLLLQQMNAALQQHGNGSEKARDRAESTIFLFARAAFRDIPAAVHCCMQRTASLKQRRQLLRLWAGLLTALMQGAGAWCACSSCSCMHLLGCVWRAFCPQSTHGAQAGSYNMSL
jgi:hypothetical protein